MKTELLSVVSHETIARNIYELVLEGNSVALMTEPGQFVHIKPDHGNDPYLRRPISICDIDAIGRRLTVLYRAEGAGTRVLAGHKPGDTIDVLGPLGTGFPVEAASPGDTALLVGGGIGVPPLYYLAKQLIRKGVRVIHVLGFAGAEDVFYKEKFEALGTTYIATVDGSSGMKGFVTDVIDREGLTFDTLYACGPTAMLKALEQRYRGRKAYLSLEERMACGVGACYACVCRVQDDPQGSSYRRVCKDGPVFPAGEVIL